MDSVLEDDPTLPLDISYRPDMYLTNNSDDANFNLVDHPLANDPPLPSKSDSVATSLTGISGSHYISGRMSPSSSNRNMKDYATQISDLKKENFSLKLRIFYMEEKMTEQFSGDQDQLWKTNIELKVECDSLRKELGEKHDLLVKASNAVACMEVANNPEEAQKAKLEADKEMAQLRELMDEKVANAERELQVAHQDSEHALEQAMKLKQELLNSQQRVKELNEALKEALDPDKRDDDNKSENERSRKPNVVVEDEDIVTLQRNLNDLKDELEEKKRTMDQLQQSLFTKQDLIEALTEEKESFRLHQVQPLTQEIESLTLRLQAAETVSGDASKIEKDHQRYQDHINEQQQRLDEFELATRQMSDELDKRDEEITDLKDALKDANDMVKDLNDRLEEDAQKAKGKHEKAAKDINKRDRALTALTMAVRNKDSQITELTREIDELKLEVDALKLDIEERDAKAIKLLADLKKAKSDQIATSPSKESLIKQLRDQLKESDAALQTQKKRNVEMRAISTQSDSYLTSQSEEKLPELNSVLETQQNKARQLEEQLKKTESSLQALKDKKVGMRAKSTQSDSYLTSQPGEKLQESYSIRELKRTSSVNETLLLQLRQQLLDAESALQTQRNKARHLEEQLKESDDSLQAMKERKVEMRAKSTQSDSYLILQPEKKVQESDSVLQAPQEKIIKMREKSTQSDSYLNSQAEKNLQESQSVLQTLKEIKIEMREKSTQSDGYLNSQAEEKLQESDLVLELKRTSSVNETLLLQLRHQLVAANSALQTQQNKVRHLQEQLEETDDILQNALDERSHFEDERNKCERELNQHLRDQNRQIERLKSQIANYEETVSSLEENSKGKEWELQDLNTKYKKVIKELKQSMDDKNRLEDEHEKHVREATQQAKENSRQIDRLKSLVSEYEESTASLESTIKEKEWQLQELTSKHKNLSKDLRNKEEECVRAILERDELQSQCEDEKNRFSTLAEKMLRRSGSDASVGSSQIELEALSRVRELEDELLKKNQALAEAAFDRDRAERDQVATRQELDEALSTHEREMDKNNREIGLKDVEIRQLKDMLRDTEDKMHECENQMQSEINKLVRQNSDLRERLRMSEEELTHLKPKRSKTEFDEKTKLSQDLVQEMQDLRRELKAKDEELKKMHQELLHRTLVDENGGKLTQNVTFNDDGARSLNQKNRSGLRVSRYSSSSLDDENCNDVTISDVSHDEQATPQFNRLRQVHTKNCRGNLTIDTTLGLPLDETSYMSIANGGYHNENDVASINELKQLLSDTRKQLSNAVRELANLKLVSTEQVSKIESLERLVDEKALENNTLMDEYNKVNQQKIAKELEIRGLLTQLREGSTNIKQHFVDVDALRIDSATESDSATMSTKSHQKSGEESDGMSSLSKRELCKTISHLKKKLGNAEKVNDLLTQQMNDVNKMDSQSADNTQLVADLTAEVQRLKSQLEAQSERDFDRESPTRTSLRLMPSKLPLPKSQKGQNKVGLRPELERARMLNKKLNDRLAATEQTVRMQADKLNKCRVAMREAGIGSPPLSPLRAARSVPDLHIPSELYRVDKEHKRERTRSLSADTNDVSTQTSDSGISSLSAKSEQSFNSLIQAQAKELSLLREQLKKSRDTCKHLQTEMDMLSRYISILSASEQLSDPSMVTGIEEEINRSKKLVAKLKTSLKENTDELAASDVDSDSSVVASPLPLSVYEIHQLERMKNEMKDKDDKITDLQEKIKSLETALTSKPRERSSLNANPIQSAEKWSSTPNLLPQHSSTLAAQGHSPSSALKKKPSSVGSPYQSKNEHGLLTPGSSFLSLHSASEDEIKLLQHDDSSRMPTRYGDNDDRYASLPDVLDKPQRSSWPNGHGRVTSSSQTKRRSMPMYQRTIAVTEYLPPNGKSNKGDSYSAASEPDEVSHRRFLLTSDSSRCSASYGGKWATASRSAENLRPSSNRTRPSPWESTRLDRVDVGESSCDEVQGDRNHKLAREVDRLRRRLTDSKRINRSLKEELDIANKSLTRTKDGLVPGYQKSSHHDAELLAEHLSEIRGLRQRLEQSIATNDRLREKLETRLKDTFDTSRDDPSICVGSKGQQSAPESSRIKKLERKLERIEAENEKLRKRMQPEEQAYSAYEKAIEELKALQLHLVEKSDKIEGLTQHVKQLQYEVEQQTSLSAQLGEKLLLRDTDIGGYKQKLKEMENDKDRLVEDNKNAHESNKRMFAELESYRSQLDECRHLVDSLKSELSLYEKLQAKQAGSFSTPVQLDLSELLDEIRSLRIELEKSIAANAALRNQLEEQFRSPHGRIDSPRTTINIHHVSPRSPSGENAISHKRSPPCAKRKLKLEATMESENVLMTPPASASSGGEEHNFNFDPLELKQSLTRVEDPTFKTTTQDSASSLNISFKEKPFYSRGGPYQLCRSDDFLKLQQKLAKSGLVARTADNKVAEIISNIRRANNPESKTFKELSKSTSSLCHLLDDGDVLLRLFWPVLIPYPSPTPTIDSQRRSSNTGMGIGAAVSSSASVPIIRRHASDMDSSITSEADGLRREVGRLRRRLSTQDRLLQSTVDRLHNTNKLKEGIENAIVKQLTRTHDVIKQARGNLEQAHDSEKRSYVP